MFLILVFLIVLGEFLRERCGGQNHLYSVILKLEVFQLDS